MPTGMPRDKHRGQALLMMTMSLPVMFGLMALVVDTGWCFWRTEACKTAAQAAASAAAITAKSAANLTCGNGVACTAHGPPYVPCPASPSAPASDDLQSGCLYAMQNGYTFGG